MSKLGMVRKQIRFEWHRGESVKATIQRYPKRYKPQTIT